MTIKSIIKSVSKQFSSSAFLSIEPSLSSFEVIGQSNSIKIQSVTNHGFKIDDKIIHGPLVVLKNDLYKWKVPQYGILDSTDTLQSVGTNATVDGFNNPSSPFHSWKPEMFSLFIKNKPELILIGSGTSISFLPPKIKQYLLGCGIQVEVLNSKIACSTFNVLNAEGRDVALAAIPIVPTSHSGETLVQVHRK
jgi:NADH dehydrogenase [ubiquinone] 1 alpha subcomplex assembly factor 3